METLREPVTAETHRQRARDRHNGLFPVGASGSQTVVFISQKRIMSNYRPCALNQYMTNMRVALMGNVTKSDPFAGRMLTGRHAQITAELDGVRKTRQFSEFQ